MPNPPDPIAPVITALNFLVQGSSASPFTATQNDPLFTTTKDILGVLFSASTSMTQVGTSINTALTDTANVITQIGGKLAGLAPGTDVTDAMNGLQQGLAMAQTLAPSSASAVLNSGSQLFQTIQNLVQALGDVTQAGNELQELGGQLTLLATLF